MAKYFLCWDDEIRAVCDTYSEARDARLWYRKNGCNSAANQMYIARTCWKVDEEDILMEGIMDGFGFMD